MATDRIDRSQTDKPFEAAVMMAWAMLSLPLMDAAAKYLAMHEAMTPGSIALLRFALQTMIIVPIILVSGGFAALRPHNWSYNLLRGLLIGSASTLFFISVKYVPVADVIAIFFVEPFILTAMSAFFLGERVGWRRWLAIAVGFIGAIIVIQPNFARFGLVSLLPLVTATLFALYLILNRVLSARDTSLVMQYSAGIGGVIAVSFGLMAGTAFGVEDLTWSMPSSAFALLLLAVIGLISAFGHMVIVTAFRHAPASLLAPFQYFEIVSAVTIGYLVFGDFPSASKWLGIAIIVGSGLFILWREQRSAAPRTGSS